LIVVVILCLIGVLTGPQLGGAIEALTPPRLPTENSGIEPVWRGDQNWTAEQADQFHFTPQGTQTLPIPLSWFLALEQPLDPPFAIPFGNRGRLADSRYLARFGFIPAERSRFNPDGLPIGFAISPDQTIAGITQKEAAIGLTCAACHTEQRIYGGKRYVIDGGPATIDLGQLTGALRAALGQTAVSGYLPLFDGRFERFARAVLGNEYSDLTRNQLAQELGATIKQLADQPSGIAVTEG
jgi:hypothetical protein